MKTTKPPRGPRRLALAALLVACVGGAAAAQGPASATRYGSLAIDRRDGERYGWAVDYPTLDGADARALAECRTKSQQCQVVLRFSDECGAYVVERGNGSLYGWGTAPTRAAAESRANGEARERGGRDLVVRVWGCTTRQPRERPSEQDRLAEELAAARARRAREQAAADSAERARLQSELLASRERRAREAADSMNRGRLRGRVTDALTRGGIANATVTVVSDAASFTVVTAGDGSYTTPTMPPGTYTVSAAAANYQPATLHGAGVTAAQTSTVVSIPLVPASDRPGTISGTVRNARNARPMGAVAVELRGGIGARGGAPVAVVTTGADGRYRFADLPAGTYSVTARLADFVDGALTGIAVGGSEVGNQDLLLSPVGTEHEIRIVLSWGANPNDLDSYLFGPSASGGRFRVNYQGRGSLDGGPFAALDVDDTQSYGPETITITQLQPGVYRYAVQHFGGYGSLSTSGALVRVYRGSTLLDQFEPPAGASGSKDVWQVFELEGTTLRPINVITRSFPN